MDATDKNIVPMYLKARNRDSLAKLRINTMQYVNLEGENATDRWVFLWDKNNKNRR